jgi:4-hydroxybenzoate-CoA ligase
MSPVMGDCDLSGPYAAAAPIRSRAFLMTIYNACADLLDRMVDQGRGETIAFIDPDRSLTYAQLQEGTWRFANLLRRLGIRREERILLLLTDTVDFPIIFLGAIRAGVVPVPVNTMLAMAQYSYMLEDARARALFVSASLLSTVEPCLAEETHLDRVGVVGGAPQDQKRDQSGHLDFAAHLATETAEFATVATHPDETAFWLYSSGSTGAPKGTKHVHASLMATARLFAQGIIEIKETDIVYSAAKLFFAYGLGNALTFPMSVGATAILEPGRPTPDKVFEILDRHTPTIFCGVPTLFSALLNDGKYAQHKGSSRLRICTSAGEALPEHIGTAWTRRFGVDIIDGVGSTEMLHIFLSNRPGDVVYGTSGKPVPGYDVRLTDEAGVVVADGEVGELFVRGPSAAEGYWNQRDKSRGTFHGEWTRTGDKYTRDASGRYTYCGRTDDMFKVSGIWVSPFEVETALMADPAVLEAAVVPFADEDGLLKPKAFIVLKEGADRENLEQRLKDDVKAKAGMWKYPRWIEIIESLPKTATGKIQRYKLRDVA